MSVNVEMEVNKDGKKELVVTERIELSDYEDTNNKIVSYLINKDKLFKEINKKYCTHQYKSGVSSVKYKPDSFKSVCKICGTEFSIIGEFGNPEDINDENVKDICHTLLAYGAYLNIFEQAYIFNILESEKYDKEELFKLYTSTRKIYSYKPQYAPNGYQFTGYDNSIQYITKKQLKDIKLNKKDEFLKSIKLDDKKDNNSMPLNDCKRMEQLKMKKYIEKMIEKYNLQEEIKIKEDND